MKASAGRQSYELTRGKQPPPPHKENKKTPVLCASSLRCLADDPRPTPNTHQRVDWLQKRWEKERVFEKKSTNNNEVINNHRNDSFDLQQQTAESTIFMFLIDKSFGTAMAWLFLGLPLATSVLRHAQERAAISGNHLFVFRESNVKKKKDLLCHVFFFFGKSGAQLIFFIFSKASLQLPACALGIRSTQPKNIFRSNRDRRRGQVRQKDL